VIGSAGSNDLGRDLGGSEYSEASSSLSCLSPATNQNVQAYSSGYVKPTHPSCMLLYLVRSRTNHIQNPEILLLLAARVQESTARTHSQPDPARKLCSNSAKPPEASAGVAEQLHCPCPRRTANPSGGKLKGQSTQVPNHWYQIHVLQRSIWGLSGLIQYRPRESSDISMGSSHELYRKLVYVLQPSC
jgi:hypothetical protein